MVMRPSSPKRQRLSSARKSIVARLAVRTADDTRGAVGEHDCTTGKHECAGDGTGMPQGGSPAALREAAC
jgi:hypothetical protein